MANMNLGERLIEMMKLKSYDRFTWRLLLPFLSLLLVLVATAPPAFAAPIVQPKQVYTYETMTRDMKALVERYPQLITMSSIGTSEYNRELWKLTIGNGPAVILLNGSHHAREWMTTTLLMKMAEQYAEGYTSSSSYEQIQLKELLERTTVVLVPMVNPDGVTLQQKGLSAFPEEARAALIQMNGGSDNFTRWKANAKGIDLNRQYPAGWETIHNNRSTYSYMNYKGSKPLQAKEAAAMAALARELQPQLAMSYHSSGEVIYWNYKTKQSNLARDRALAGAYASMTGYRLVQPSANPSGGGFTDWFITEFERPAMTPEIARAVSERHVPLSEWDRIWSQHKQSAWMLLYEGYQLWMSTQKAESAISEVYMPAQTTLYQYPGWKQKEIGTAAAGFYKQLRTKGDWIELQTGEGRGWVSANVLLSGIEPVEDMMLQLGDGTSVYASPLQDRPTSLRYDGQKLKPLLVWQDWYMVEASGTPRWVRASQVTVIPAASEEQPQDNGSGEMNEDNGAKPDEGGADEATQPGQTDADGSNDAQTPPWLATGAS